MVIVKQLQIGKQGLTENFIEQVRNAFKNSEQIRISILKSATRDKEQAKKIADQLLNNLGKNFTYKFIGYVLVVIKWRKPRQS